MATSNKLLEALISAQYQPEQDPYGIAAQGIAAGAPGLYNPYASTGTNALYTGGAALLAGLLGGFAANRTEERNAELFNQMQTLRNASPEERQAAVKQNPRLSVFANALEADAIEREREIAQKRQEQALQRENKLYETMLGRGQVLGSDGKVTELFDPMQDEARKARLVETAKQEAIRSVPGLAPDEARKLEVDYTKTLTTGNEAQKYLQVRTQSENVLKSLEEQNPIRAASAIYSMARILDPLGAVRESDGRMVADPGGPLGELARWHNEILQKGQITDDAARNMRELVPVLLQNQYAGYKTLADTQLGAAKKQGANIDNIGYLPEPELTPQVANIEVKTLRDGSQVKVMRQPDGSFVEVN